MYPEIHNKNNVQFVKFMLGGTEENVCVCVREIETRKRIDIKKNKNVKETTMNLKKS